MSIPELNPWIVPSKRNKLARMRLICVPYAGGNAAIFRAWPAQLPGFVEVYPLEFPGGLRRVKDPLFTRMEPLIDELSQFLLPHLDRPFCLFGSCTGSFIAFELAHRLQEVHGLEAAHLFVSNIWAPHLPPRKQPIFGYDDAAFSRELTRYGAMPQETLAQSELFNLLLPAIRADFELSETYAYHAGRKVRCPLTAIGGYQDHIMPPEDIAAWREQTAGPFEQVMLEGDHTLVHQAKNALLQVLSQRLKNDLQIEREETVI